MASVSSAAWWALCWEDGAKCNLGSSISAFPEGYLAGPRIAPLLTLSATARTDWMLVP